MNERAVGIIDEPNRGDQPDKLDIGRHAAAVKNRCRNTTKRDVGRSRSVLCRQCAAV